MSTIGLQSLLARVNFPPYFVSPITNRHILVAGGGGSSKTGISNSLEVYELEYEIEKDVIHAERVFHVDTGNTAFMNGTVFETDQGIFIAAGGIDGYCHVYQVDITVKDDSSEIIPNGINMRRRSSSPLQDISNTLSGHLPPTFPEDGSEVLRRRRTSSTSSNHGLSNGVASSSSPTRGTPLTPLSDFEEEQSSENASPSRRQSNGVAHHDNSEKTTFDISSIPAPILTFDVKPLSRFQCDFKKELQQQMNAVQVEDSFVKALKFCASTNNLITGGADGHLRVWNLFPSFNPNPLLDKECHSDEIVDLDTDFSGQIIVTVCRDGACCLWKRKSGLHKDVELDYQPVLNGHSKPGMKYKFKGCRFLPLEGENSRFLFTSLIPSSRTKPAQDNYLCRWDVKTFTMEKKVSVGVDPLSHMSISSDGRCIAMGSLTGGISVYDTYSMYRLYQLDSCHRSFVTKVEFLFPSEETQVLCQSYQTVVSISVDNQIVLHRIPCPSSGSFSGFLSSPLIFLTFLLLVYLACTLSGL